MTAHPYRHWPTKTGLILIDLLSITTAYFTAYSLRFWSPFFSTFKYVPIDYYLYAFPVAGIIFISCFAFLGLYETRRPYRALSLFLDGLKVASIGTLFLLPFTFWIRGFSFSRWVVILNWALLLVISPLLRCLYQRVVEALRRNGKDTSPLLIIGTGEEAHRLLKTLKDYPELGYQIVGALRGSPTSPKELENYPILGETRDLVQVFHTQGIEEVVIADETLDPHQEFLILQPCQAEGVKIRVAPALYDFALSVRGLRVIDQDCWYSLEQTVEQRWYLFVKRGMDITVSLLLLIPQIVLFPLIALWIRIESPGPVIFRQRRTGTNGKPFIMYKFRSMVQEAEKILPDIVDLQQIQRPVFKLENDPRVTRVGKVLRRFSIDELPQFYNVLRGDMSLVGPRPEELWIAGKYSDKERARLQVKPGITGFQQIHCRGSDDFEDRLRHDLFYINNQSVFLDLSILLETIWVVLSGQGRY